jgi:hypothetical protein
VVPLLEVPLLEAEPLLLEVEPLLDVLPELDPLDEPPLLPASSAPPPPPNGPPNGDSLAPLHPIQLAASTTAPRTKPVRIVASQCGEETPRTRPKHVLRASASIEGAALHPRFSAGLRSEK